MSTALVPSPQQWGRLSVEILALVAEYLSFRDVVRLRALSAPLLATVTKLLSEFKTIRLIDDQEAHAFAQLCKPVQRYALVTKFNLL